MIGASDTVLGMLDSKEDAFSKSIINYVQIVKKIKEEYEMKIKNLEMTLETKTNEVLKLEELLKTMSAQINGKQSELGCSLTTANIKFKRSQSLDIPTFDEICDNFDKINKGKIESENQYEVVNQKINLPLPHLKKLKTWSSSSKLIQKRPHDFIKKNYATQVCNPCGKIILGGQSMKCQICKTICHIQCHKNVPVPCLPVKIPKNIKEKHLLSDYIPTLPPYIPPIVIHCINTIETRMIYDPDLYFLPGSKHEVMEVKKKMLGGKGSPLLNNQSTNMLGHVLQHFLNNLTEPLLTMALQPIFIGSIGNQDTLCQLVKKLPLPNRDTLSFLMLHLQKTSQINFTLTKSQIANVFALAIVGLSQPTCYPQLLTDAFAEPTLVEQLIAIPATFWNDFINTEDLTNDAFSSSSVNTPRWEDLNTTLGERINSPFKCPGMFN